MADVHNYTWSHRTLPLEDIRSRRPYRWDWTADMTTAILQGCSAHQMFYDGTPQPSFLISVPDFLIIHRDRHVEVQRNTENIPPDARYWPDVPFSHIPGDLLMDMMIVYTQMGYR